ncbi:MULTISPECIES: pyridoxamine 5'-phosphate oxidase family protein [Sinorhizobium]|uniref:pyridoxamine 5'-phosphate oxidase family protein n=1 Tax=Sinorhizobium TaxID=28105 RepID=UPI000569FC0B|nr:MULTISPECIES: pyridoxamine 5'-phosphate oxidase family protein [Sinorhizobium]ASY56616.1 Pyridoxamine 5'-phosphate oxidase-related, FMN-binding [Sinorhizobium sp. CCBAU 05631]MCA1442900.1 pyridoxamine 5'-phosphate oxidase family protein [Ensifer sp. IC4062]RVP99623.1 pyridoxamine 5'-phosphate oxidase family protein [Sinorhizobium meliloti]
MFIKEMSRHECSSVIQAGHLARLACCNEGRPYVVPITYAFTGNCIYCFSMPGQKIDWMRANPHVCLQVDEFSGERQWKSVLVFGRYQELPSEGRWQRECVHAWSLLEARPNWWEPGGLKPAPQAVAGSSPHVFFCVDIEDMTGRAAHEGEA